MKNIISTIFVALANGEKFGSSEVSKDLKFGWDLKNVSLFDQICFFDEMNLRTVDQDRKDRATQSLQSPLLATRMKISRVTSSLMLSTFLGTNAKRLAKQIKK